MKAAETFRISFKALGDRKVRTSLTVLMVVVGSSLMVTLNGIVAGLGQFATDVFNRLAPNILFVTSIPFGDSEEEEEEGDDGDNGGGPPPFLGQGLVPVPTIVLDQAVVDRIESLPGVSGVIPSYQGRITIAAGNETESTSVLSVQPDSLRVIAPALEFAEGSAINPDDSSAIYLPSAIAKDLWGLPDAAGSESVAAAMIGEQVNVTYTYIDLATASRQSVSETFTVAGIMEPVGNPTIDRAAVFNLEAGNELLRKSGRYDSLFVAAASTGQVGQVERGIRDLYGSDIGITTSEAILQSIREFTAGFGSVISSIALVALLVGSVGIVTTMYTSVTERTREIGVMKAIGARDRNVLALFLAEAAIIGIIGASIGLVAGVLGGYGALSLFASDLLPSSGVTPHYPAGDLARVWAISLGLSVAAGLYPAWKASRLSPIVALRRD